MFPGGLGSEPGSFDLVYFLIALALSHSGSPHMVKVLLKACRKRFFIIIDKIYRFNSTKSNKKL
jgi:hypothetical protein